MNGPHIQFFGTLTRDPEQCFSQDEGIPYARLWVAVRTRYDDKQPPDTQRLRGLPVGLPHGHRGGPLPERPAGVCLRAALRPGASPGRRHPGPRPRCERQGVPLLPGGEGRPAGAGPGHQRGASGPRVLGRRDRSDSPAGDGPAAPGHITHGPAGRATQPGLTF